MPKLGRPYTWTEKDLKFVFGLISEERLRLQSIIDRMYTEPLFGNPKEEKLRKELMYLNILEKKLLSIPIFTAPLKSIELKTKLKLIGEE